MTMGTTQISLTTAAKRRLARLIPLGSAVIGMLLIFGSVAFFFEREEARVLGAAAGIAALLGSVWYASHPFLASTRRYLRLRAEVVAFIALVRKLNEAKVSGAPQGDLERAKAALHEAVDRIAAAAGVTD